MAIRAKTLTAYFEAPERAAIKNAMRRGDLSAATDAFENSNGEISFRVFAPRKFCEQLEKIVDFGATSARDVFEV